jgi:polyphosphate:AMP phosphotransferase
VFETAEIKHKVTKDEFEEQASGMRMALVDLQQQLRSAHFPVILVFAGVDGGGKGESVNLLNSWMDPRWIVTRAYGEPSEEERERPEFWRYWRDLPPKGKVGMFLSSWYSRPVLDRVYRRSSAAEFDNELERIVAFEKTLADDGALILKFWMHLGRKAQERRLKELEKNPLTSWRVSKRDWQHFEAYDRFAAAAERVVMRTSTGSAPWTIVDGRDEQYRVLTVTTILRDAIRKHLKGEELRLKLRAEEKAQRAQPEPAKNPGPRAKGKRLHPVDALALVTRRTILGALDTTKRLSAEAYESELHKQHARVNKLVRRAKAKGISSILVFEGWDAAGKGGTIRRVTSGIDARDYQVIPIAAPTDEERAQHYLWRFWRHLARAGRVTIFDRSWYGRVLVERVEGFATEAEWMRAYAEINAVEEELVGSGIVLVKYWLHITKQEQERRFLERRDTPYKAWKLTDEDWRNREKWEPYEIAVDHMVERTSTSIAPWVLVEANDKRYARVKVMRAFGDLLEKRLDK